MVFHAPKLEIVGFNVEDIITASGIENGLTISGVVPGATITFDRTHVSTIYGSCPLNGLTHGKDFVCVSGYNA